MIDKEKLDAGNQAYRVTKRDLLSAWARWIVSVDLANSWERMQAVASCALLAPILAKIYSTKEQLSEALRRHLVVYNSEGLFGLLLHGALIAMEEEKGRGADISGEAIVSLKTGMMGPLAGLGDTINVATIRPIIFSIFLPIASQGNWMGGFGPLLFFALFMSSEGLFFLNLGYRLGRQSILTVLEGGWIQQLIEGAGVVGLFMIGSMASQYVRLSTTVSWMTGSNTVMFQKTLDSILPGLLPLLLIFSTYWYLQKKGRYTPIIVITVAVAIVGSLVGIL